MDLTAELERHFGFCEFRAGQREACQAALGGRDSLVVMPTGSGKSLCYQLPALLRDELTLVVSPLVALMHDQVEALRARGFGDRVALVNAQQDRDANEQAIARAVGGRLSLLYVAPERFSAPGFSERMRAARVGLFVVDEAHCVSQWGHDFRPDYFRLADAARYVGAGALMASTATATPRVANDVVRRLGLHDPLRVTTGFDRPNISFAVVRPAAQEGRDLLAQALRRPESLPAIVYAGTRAGTEEIAEQLTAELGEECLAYHAGLARARRAEVQRRFLADEARVVVATNAFGMGVDKPNVRTVVHAAVPSSLEAYYQEAGRGGRDGLPARALLLAEGRDKALHVHFIKRSTVDERSHPRLVKRLEAAADERGRFALDAAQLARDVAVDGDGLRALVGQLAQAAVVEPTPSAPDRVAGRIAAAYDRRAAALCRASAAEGVRSRWRQYREIWAYVESQSCRRRTVLRHFGDRSEPAPQGPCCDACDGGLLPTPPAPDPTRIADLDEAILSVAANATPGVGRTTCAAILHGARTQKIARNSYDGLAAYGASARLRRREILARIDQLIAEHRLITSGGHYPVLGVPRGDARLAPAR